MSHERFSNLCDIKSWPEGQQCHNYNNCNCTKTGSELFIFDIYQWTKVSSNWAIIFIGKRTWEFLQIRNDSKLHQVPIPLKSKPISTLWCSTEIFLILNIFSNVGEKIFWLILLRLKRTLWYELLLQHADVDQRITPSKVEKVKLAQKTPI